MLDWFADVSWVVMLLIALAINVNIVVSSVALWHLAGRRRGTVELARPVSRRDVVLTSSTVVVNAVTLLPAWWLWTEGVITVAAIDPLRVVIETVYLTLAVDLVMYGAHRLFHIDPLYRWFHEVHHTGDEPNSALTLFVMHPFEASGFGLLMLVLLVVWPISILGVGLFFTINWLAGTLAHVPVDGPPTAFERLFGGSALHQAHHDQPRSAYGFFTTVSDRVFGSLPSGW